MHNFLIQNKKIDSPLEKLVGAIKYFHLNMNTGFHFSYKKNYQDFYYDLSPKIDQFNGVKEIRYSKKNCDVHDLIEICQWLLAAITNYEKVDKSLFTRTVNHVFRLIETNEFLCDHNLDQYEKKWKSALSYAFVMMFLVRFRKIDPSADRFLNMILDSFYKHLGDLTTSKDGLLIFLEYPNAKSGAVLNGHLTVIIALLDLSNHSCGRVKPIMERLLSELPTTLMLYSLEGGWFRYSLKPEPASMHYVYLCYLFLEVIVRECQIELVNRNLTLDFREITFKTKFKYLVRKIRG